MYVFQQALYIYHHIYIYAGGDSWGHVRRFRDAGAGGGGGRGGARGDQRVDTRHRRQAGPGGAISRAEADFMILWIL